MLFVRLLSAEKKGINYLYECIKIVVLCLLVRRENVEEEAVLGHVTPAWVVVVQPMVGHTHFWLLEGINHTMPVQRQWLGLLHIFKNK
jgi:hypothetical protein